MLEKIPHRDYSEASLEIPAGKDSVCFWNRDSIRKNDYEMTGKVIEVKKGHYLAVQVHNPFEIGQKLEVLTFDGTSVPIHVQHIEDISGTSLSRALPNRVVLLPPRDGIAPLNVIRRKTT